jgi:hypothetical protein
LGAEWEWILFGEPNFGDRKDGESCATGPERWDELIIMVALYLCRG